MYIVLSVVCVCVRDRETERQKQRNKQTTIRQTSSSIGIAIVTTAKTIEDVDYICSVLSFLCIGLVGHRPHSVYVQPARTRLLAVTFIERIIVAISSN